MTGVYVMFRGQMSKISMFEKPAQAEVYAAWVRDVFAYDSVVVVPV